MDMQRTTIVLPEDLKEAAEELAEREGISLAELIRRQLRAVTSERQANGRRRDPIFRRFKPWEGPGPRDAAARHDEYLYGPRRSRR